MSYPSAPGFNPHPTPFNPAYMPAVVKQHEPQVILPRVDGGGAPYPSAPGYPSAPVGAPYPPAGGAPYPPAPAGYPPAPSGYPPAQGGYPPAPGGYPPAPGGYPPTDGGYPPSVGFAQPYPSGPQQGYPPPQGYPQPQHGFNAPGGYPPSGGVGAPISQQPLASGEGWMNAPPKPSSCPPGLEYLTTLDQLLVKQKVELLEVLTGFESQNKYTVKNSLGQKVFYAVEDSSCCGRCLCSHIRPLDIKILDNFKNEVIHLNRPLAADSCCFPCCLQRMEVFSPPGCLVGTVEQEWTLLTPKFSVRNANGDRVLYIKGPLCAFSICGTMEFEVLALDEQTVVGRISKQWSGLLREAFTDADYFGMTFPVDLDVKCKATLLGALFLIDLMYFEKGQGESQF